MFEVCKPKLKGLESFSTVSEKLKFSDTERKKFENIFPKLKEGLHRILRFKNLNQEEFDILTETILVLFEKYRDRPEEELLKISWSVMRNLLIRKCSNKPKALVQESWCSLSENESDEETPEEQCTKRERDMILREIIENIPKKEKSVIDYVFYKGNSVSETARLLGKRQSTVNSRYIKALERIKTQLQKKWKDYIWWGE